MHDVIDAPGYCAHIVAALAAHVSGVQVTPPLLLVLPPPLLLLPLLPPPAHATPPVTPKQIGAPGAKQQLALKPYELSVHDCAVAPGYAPHAVDEPVAQVGVVHVVPPLLLPVLLPPSVPLLLPLLLPPQVAPTSTDAHAPPPLLLLAAGGAQSAYIER